MNRLSYLTYIKFRDLPRDENGGYTVEALDVAYTDGVMSKNMPDLPTEQYVASLIDELNETKYELNRYKAMVPKWFKFIKTFKIW